MHNVLTPRGAPIRDSLAWSKYLGEAIELFGDDTDVTFAQHHWPRFGNERVIDYLGRHRDMYSYLHEQGDYRWVAGVSSRCLRRSLARGGA